MGPRYLPGGQEETPSPFFIPWNLLRAATLTVRLASLSRREYARRHKCKCRPEVLMAHLKTRNEVSSDL